MINFKVLCTAISITTLAIGIPAFGMQEDETLSLQVTNRIKVSDIVHRAFQFEEVGNYKEAQRLYLEALESISEAMETEKHGLQTDIDLSGKVESGISIQHPDGLIEKEYVYNDSLSSEKIAASVAHRAANSAEKTEDFLTAAQTYHLAGILRGSGAAAQIWHRLSAKNYVQCSKYGEALTEFDLAAKVAIEFYPLRDEYIYLLPELIEDCSTLANSLIASGNRETALAFSERAKKWKLVGN